MISFLDLQKINSRFQQHFEVSFKESLEQSHLILGPNVSKFEQEFADYCGSKYCLGTANGLDAMTLILKAYIQIGALKEGDKVIVPANTYIATILSVLHANLVPVLVEPDPKTYNIAYERVKEAIANDVKAIVLVHLYGQLADVESLSDLANKHQLLLIEDAAQAHGAETGNKFQNSNSKTQSLIAGNIGHAAAFSFYPSKNLGALGDGGAITTNNKHLYEQIKRLRNYGSVEKYHNDVVGYNSRLDDIQAGFLSIKLKELDADNARRRAIATQYLQQINNPKIQLPYYDGSKNHVFHVFVVEVEDRDSFIKHLNAHAIGWLIHYPIPPHKQKALQQFSNLKFPITEQTHRRIISLPISPVMTNDEVQTVVSVLNTY